MLETKKIISRIRTGGQSGVDRAAMDFARENDIPLCGWCPKNGWAEDYPDPPGVLADYPELTETPSEGTEQRTKWNMRDCDAILTIIPEGSSSSPGTDIGLKKVRCCPNRCIRRQACRMSRILSSGSGAFRTEPSCALAVQGPANVRRLMISQWQSLTSLKNSFEIRK